MFGKKESPVVTLMKKLAVPTLTIVGSGVTAYFGARKGVADTVEECATALQKVVPTFEGLLSRAEEAANAAPAAPAPAPAESEELAKYKEAIKKLMAEKAELEKAAAQPAKAKAEAPKAEAKPAEAPKAEAPEAPKKEKKEKKDDAKAESQAEAK